MGKKVRKLERTVDGLYAKNVLLEAKVANLQTTISMEKAKRKRGKPLLAQEDLEDGGAAKFWSPNKIDTAKQRLQEEARQKDAAQAQKEEERRARLQAKEERQLLVAQRQAKRKEARLQRVEETERKKQLRAELAQQREADKQLTADIKQVEQYQQNHSAKSKARSKQAIAPKEAAEEEGVAISSSRSGRKIKAPKQFDNSSK